MADVGYDRKRLGAIEYALAAAGIPAEWKPFSPTEAPLLKLFGLRETRFWLRVPEDDAEAARELVADVDAGRSRRAELTGTRRGRAARELGPRPAPCVLYFLGYNPLPRPVRYDSPTAISDRGEST